MHKIIKMSQKSFQIVTTNYYPNNNNGLPSLFIYNINIKYLVNI